VELWAARTGAVLWDFQLLFWFSPISEAKIWNGKLGSNSNVPFL
jgi:hypothetical protein